MCLGTLCQVVGIEPDGRAVVVAGARRSTVSLLTLTEPVRPGAWLLVHSGLALAVLTAEQAEDARGIRAGRERQLP